MEWKIKHTPQGGADAQWSVFVDAEGQTVLKHACETREDAERFINEEELRIAEPLNKHCDCVDEASLESFPCSDPPAWTSMTASTCASGDCK